MGWEGRAPKTSELSLSVLVEPLAPCYNGVQGTEHEKERGIRGGTGRRELESCLGSVGDSVHCTPSTASALGS